MSTQFSRRGFLRASGSAGALALAGCAGMPAVTSSRSPNGKLRHACIGCGSQGRSNIAKFATHKRIEMAAFCDVDMLMLDKLRAKFPKARFYQNWREMLEKEDLDSVMVATPDHNHCEIMSEVMKRNLNLYAEKPLCRSFEECRQLESLASNSGVVTQLGMQIAQWECDRHTAALLSSGAIGKVKKVWLFSNSGYYAKLLERKWPLQADPVPATLDWKGWLSSAPYRPYSHNRYHSFVWRAWRDFGSGWLGDMGSHLFSPVWQGMNLGRTAPLSAKASVYDCGWNEEMKRQFLPLYSHVTWQFPGVKATGMQPFEVEWCDGPSGGQVPKEFLPQGKTEEIAGNKAVATGLSDEFLPPKRFHELAAKTPLGKLPVQGRVIEGSDGWMISTHFNLPPVLLTKGGKARPLSLPFVSPVPNHYHEFVDCCLDGGKASTDFNWTCRLTDWLLLGRQAIDNPGKTIKFV